MIAVAAAGLGLPLVEKHFVMMGDERVDGKMAGALYLGDIVVLREEVGRIRRGGVDPLGQTVLRHRGHHPARVSTYQSRGPCLGGFVLVVRQSR